MRSTRSKPDHSFASPLTLVSLLALAGGCSLIASVDPDKLDDGSGGAGAEGGGGEGGEGATGAQGGGGMGGGGMGGDGGCADASECPNVGECAEPACDDGTCGETPLAAGTACSTGVCDGASSCVECVEESDCAGPNDACIENQCVSPLCRNRTLDGDETDVDCGGMQCPPCAVTEMCSVFSDCESGFCDNGTCATCTDNAQCQNDFYCDVGGTDFCEDKLALGVACTADRECASDECVDGVCCDTACDTECEACNLGGSMGTCSAVTEGTADPVCTPDVCGVGGDCRCSDQSANGNETDTDCGGPECNACINGQTCAQATDCTSGFCDVTTCAACTDSNDCQNNQFCNLGTGVCEGTLANGAACTAGGECMSGECADDVCCDTACDGDCMACDTGTVGTCEAHAAGTDPDGDCGTDTCGALFGECRCSDLTSNGQETGTDCGGPVCGACGNGQGCTLASDCTSNYCPAGTCLACTGAGQCGAGLFCDIGSGMCMAQVAQGDPCTIDEQCDTGACADDVCCDMACDGDCMACDTGTVGMCEGYAEGTDPEGDCAPDTCGATFGQCRCSDGALNGAETDTDCGGGTCGTCDVGDGCSVPGDCTVGACTADVCGEVWINELHYDNDGTDQDEGVEIAGTAGLDLTDWTILAYNGNGGVVYDTEVLAGALPDQQNGFGTLNFPIAGLQNGAPDGVALVGPTGVVAEFLSYEGSFSATAGPAMGLMSMDIGVEEIGTTTIGLSLQRFGLMLNGPGTWGGPMTSTAGAANPLEFTDFAADLRGYTDQGGTATWAQAAGAAACTSTTGAAGTLTSPTIDATGLLTDVSVVLTHSVTVTDGTAEVIVNGMSLGTFNADTGGTVMNTVNLTSEAANSMFTIDFVATDGVTWTIEDVTVTGTP